jgi:hypothetical protein
LANWANYYPLLAMLGKNGLMVYHVGADLRSGDLVRADEAVLTLLKFTEELGIVDS